MNLVHSIKVASKKKAPAPLGQSLLFPPRAISHVGARNFWISLG